jgi:hypothetical protein
MVWGSDVETVAISRVRHGSDSKKARRDGLNLTTETRLLAWWLLLLWWCCGASN